MKIIEFNIQYRPTMHAVCALSFNNFLACIIYISKKYTWVMPVLDPLSFLAACPKPVEGLRLTKYEFISLLLRASNFYYYKCWFYFFSITSKVNSLIVLNSPPIFALTVILHSPVLSGIII